jgi:hypothetical protein
MSEKQVGKKEIVMGIFFTGIAFFVIPIFWHNKIAEPILRFCSYGLMFIAIVYLIAGDTLVKKIFKIKGKYDGMTDEQIMSKKQSEYESKYKQAEMELNLEQKRLEIEKKRAEINKLREGVSGSSKFPDVLGNLAPMMDGTKNKGDNDLKDFKKFF